MRHYSRGVLIPALFLGTVALIVFVSLVSCEAELTRRLQEAEARCLSQPENEFVGRKCVTPKDKIDDALRQAEYDWCKAQEDKAIHERCQQFVTKDSKTGKPTFVITTNGVVPGIGIGSGIGIGIDGGVGVAF